MKNLLNDYVYADQVGRKLAEILQIKSDGKDGNIKTMYGSKSYAGLSRTVYNVLKEYNGLIKK